jgi:tRNA dimethylallyltransferase
MQVYRGMDIGTAKPTRAEQSEVPHHLLDICEPDDDYTVSRFQHDCLEVLAGIESRGHRALLVGGTGLYVRAITDDLEIPGVHPETRAELDAESDTTVLFARLAQLDPAAATRMEPTNRRRVLRALEVTIGSGRPFSSFGPGLEVHPPAPFPIIGLDMSRDLLDRRIGDRYDRQLEDGFVAEVSGLLARSAGLGRTARQALGYAEILDHLESGAALDEAMVAAVARTRRFARRQQRWFGRDPRIRWIATDGQVDDNALAALAETLVD